jgi:hypothetical protein
MRYSITMTNAKSQKTVTLTVTAKDFGTRDFVFYTVHRNPAEKQAAHWTKVWTDAGHTVVRK